jgi:hypothetical protein
VTLDMTAAYPCSAGEGQSKFVEFEYFLGAQQWVPINISSWIPYTDATEDYPWTLLPTFGIRFMSAWAADDAGNISLAPGQDFIDLLPQEQSGYLAQGGVHLYRFYLEAGQNFSAQLTSVSGDGDLYVWGPDGVLVTYSNNHPGLDSVAFSATVQGIYQVEVVGYTAVDYLLNLNSSMVAAGAEQSTSTKAVRTAPAVPVNSWPEYYNIQPPSVQPATHSKLYLPAIMQRGQ